MTERLDNQHQKLAVSLFVLLVILVTSAIAIPVWSVNAGYRESIGQMQERLGRLRQLASNDEQLRPRYEQIKAAQSTAGNYLKSSTEAVAAAELQGILKRLAGSNGAQVLSTQILAAREEEQFVRVALRARLRGTFTGIIDTFYAVETNDVFLFLDNVSLRDSTDRRRALQTTGAQFEVDIDLITFMAADL